MDGIESREKRWDTIVIFQIILRDGLDWGGGVTEPVSGRDRCGVFFWLHLWLLIVFTGSPPACSCVRAQVQEERKPCCKGTSG